MNEFLVYCGVLAAMTWYDVRHRLLPFRVSLLFNLSVLVLLLWFIRWLTAG